VNSPVGIINENLPTEGQPKFAKHHFNALDHGTTKEKIAEALGVAVAVNAGAALVKLHRDNASTLTPDPIYSAVNDSHPSAAQRVARLQAWSGPARVSAL